MRIFKNSVIATAAAATIALTTMSIQPAAAGYRHGHGNGAALGAFAAIIGTVGAIIAAEQYRDRYEPPYAYGGAYPAPVYVPRRHWRHHRHW